LVGFVDLVYFGSLREALGRDVERIEPPSHVLTIEDLLRWLSERGEPYRGLFADRTRVRAAVDREHAGPGDSFFGAQEVALFPPPGAA
jgi:sulfur-carrier protein